MSHASLYDDGPSVGAFEHGAGASAASSAAAAAAATGSRSAGHTRPRPAPAGRKRQRSQQSGVSDKSRAKEEARAHKLLAKQENGGWKHQEVCLAPDALLAASDVGAEIIEAAREEGYTVLPPRPWTIPSSLWWRRRQYRTDALRARSAADSETDAVSAQDMGVHRDPVPQLLHSSKEAGRQLLATSAAAGRDSAAWGPDLAQGYAWERTVVRVWDATTWCAQVDMASRDPSPEVLAAPLFDAAAADLRALPLDSQLLYLVVGLRVHLENLAKAASRGGGSAPRMGWAQVHQLAAALLVRTGVQMRHALDAAEAVKFLTACSRSLAHAPYKTEVSEAYLQRIRGSLFPPPDCAGQAEPRAAVFRLTDTWFRQLQTLPGISAARASALVRRFPSLAAMIEELSKHQTEEDRVEDIAQAMGGRRQPAIARRIIHALFSDDADSAF